MVGATSSEGVLVDFMSEVTLIRELVRALERARRDTKDVFQNRFLTNNCARNIQTEPIYTPSVGHKPAGHEPATGGSQARQRWVKSPLPDTRLPDRSVSLQNQ